MEVTAYYVSLEKKDVMNFFLGRFFAISQNRENLDGRHCLIRVIRKKEVMNIL